MPTTMEEIILHPLLFQSLLSLLFFYSIFRWFQKPPRNKNLPPSPPKLPILGNLHQVGSLPHRDLHSMAQKHGPIMLLHFGSLPTLVVSSAAAAKEITKTHDIAFAQRPDSSINRRLLYNNRDLSAAPYGEYWRQLKSICVLHLLSNKRGQSFRSIREQETALLIEKIRRSSGSVNLSQMFTELTYDIVSLSAFGRRYSEGENGGSFPELLKEFLEVLVTDTIGDFVPGLRWVNRVNGFDSRADRAAKEMDKFLEGVIQERMETCSDEDDKNGDNFIDILLQIYRNNSTGVPLDRDSIKALILDVFAAGTDTTSTVLDWTMTELLKHPTILKKLQNEVREIVKDKNDITSNDLEKMHYLKAVIKETLRLHPPLPLLFRAARKDVKVMGYDVSPGTMVLINGWAIGRDPTSWAEPERFYPDRFLNSLIDYKGKDFELIPFGAGRRGCPGITFAMATIYFVLANILQKFDWTLPDGCKDLDMTERPGIAYHKDIPLIAVGSQYCS